PTPGRGGPPEDDGGRGGAVGGDAGRRGDTGGTPAGCRRPGGGRVDEVVHGLAAAPPVAPRRARGGQTAGVDADDGPSRVKGVVVAVADANRPALLRRRTGHGGVATQAHEHARA